MRRSLRTGPRLESLPAQVMEDPGDIGLHRLDVLAERQGLVERLLEIDRLVAEVPGQYEVVVIERRAQQLRQLFGVVQVSDADAAARHLVLVGGPCRA